MVERPSKAPGRCFVLFGSIVVNELHDGEFGITPPFFEAKAEGRTIGGAMSPACDNDEAEAQGYESLFDLEASIGEPVPFFQTIFVPTDIRSRP